MNFPKNIGIMCIRSEDGPTVDEVWPGSVMTPCTNCKNLVWVDPNNQALITHKEAKPYCTECMALLVQATSTGTVH